MCVCVCVCVCVVVCVCVCVVVCVRGVSADHTHRWVVRQRGRDGLLPKRLSGFPLQIDASIPPRARSLSLSLSLATSLSLSPSLYLSMSALLTGCTGSALHLSLPLSFCTLSLSHTLSFYPADPSSKCRAGKKHPLCLRRALFAVRGTLLIRNNPPVGPYSSLVCV